MTSLKQKAEAIKDLKKEYRVGSQEAYEYLKSNEDYFILRDRLSEKIGHKPPLREVANLCEKIMILVNLALGEDHSINNASKRFQKFRYGEEDESGMDELGIQFLDFDYCKALAVYYGILKEGGTQSKALTRSFIDVVSFRDKYFTDPSGKELSFRDITGKTHRQLDNQEILLGIIENFDSGSITREEFDCLMDPVSFYKRAERENTLNKLEVERRAALNSALGFARDTDDMQENLKKCITNSETNIKSAVERYEKLKTYNLSIPEWVIKDNKACLDRARYKLKAVKRNRRWLEKVLSN